MNDLRILFSAWPRCVSLRGFSKRVGARPAGRWAGAGQGPRGAPVGVRWPVVQRVGLLGAPARARQAAGAGAARRARAVGAHPRVALQQALVHAVGLPEALQLGLALRGVGAHAEAGLGQVDGVLVRRVACGAARSALRRARRAAARPSTHGAGAPASLPFCLPLGLPAPRSAAAAAWACRHGRTGHCRGSAGFLSARPLGARRHACGRPSRSAFGSYSSEPVLAWCAG